MVPEPGLDDSRLPISASVHAISYLLLDLKDWWYLRFLFWGEDFASELLSAMGVRLSNHWLHNSAEILKLFGLEFLLLPVDFTHNHLRQDLV